MHESETELEKHKWNGFLAEVVIATRIRPFHFVHESGTVSSHGNDRRAWLLQNGTMR